MVEILAVDGDFVLAEAAVVIRIPGLPPCLGPHMILPSQRRSPLSAQSRPEAVARLTELVCELLDAHWETSRIANDCDLDDAWRAHLMYLRDLQRVARELLAQAGQPIGATNRRFPA